MRGYDNMTKVAFIGAGSLVFTKNLVCDLLTFPAFEDCTIALMDIDPLRLEFAKQAVDNIISAGNYHAKVETTTNRAEVLTGASGVVCTILVGGLEVWWTDLEMCFGVPPF